MLSLQIVEFFLSQDEVQVEIVPFSDAING